MPVGPRVLPRIIHDQPHWQCKRIQPGGLLVLHLEHPRVAAPTDSLRAGDDLARSAADEHVLRRGHGAYLCMLGSRVTHQPLRWQVMGEKVLAVKELWTQPEAEPWPLCRCRALRAHAAPSSPRIRRCWRKPRRSRASPCRGVRRRVAVCQLGRLAVAASGLPGAVSPRSGQQPIGLVAVRTARRGVTSARPAGLTDYEPHADGPWLKSAGPDRLRFRCPAGRG